jgi:hypothetical protein
MSLPPSLSNPLLCLQSAYIRCISFSVWSKTMTLPTRKDSLTNFHIQSSLSLPPSLNIYALNKCHKLFSIYAF